MRVVLQTRNTFQWHCVPVTESVWPPGTMWNTFFSKLTLAIACASAELMLPSRKLTWSRSISLLAFCTATAAVAAGRILDQQFDLAAENAALGVDLFDRELRADQFVLAERGEGAGQRIVEADLDRFVGERLHHKRAGDLHGAERETGFEQRPPLYGDADKIPWTLCSPLRCSLGRV